MESTNIPFDGAKRESFAFEALDSMPLVAAYVDKDLRYRFINKEFENRYRVSRETLLGNRVAAEPGDTFLNADEHIEKVLQGEQVRFEQTWKTDATQATWFEITLVPDFSQAEKPQGFFAFGQDITRQKTTETLQKEQHHLLQSLSGLIEKQDGELKPLADYVLEQMLVLAESELGFYGYLNEDETIMSIHAWSSIALKVQRLDGKPLIVPIAKTGVFGDSVRKRKTIIVNDYTSYQKKQNLPEDHPNLTRVLAVPVFRKNKIVAVGVVANKKSQYTQRDGQRLESFMSSTQIITERKQAEQALHSERNFINSIVDTAQVMIMVTDKKGRIVRINAFMERLLGYRQQELEGKNWSHTLLPQNQQTHKDRPSAQSRRSMQLLADHNQVITKKGRAIDVEWCDKTLCDAAGKVIGMVSIGSDITERKKSEEDRLNLERSMQQAQKLESLGVLAGGIAHDFNNMLVGILGNTSLMLWDLPPQSPLRRPIDQIDQSASKCAELASQMLAYSGKGKFVVEDISLRNLVEDMSEILKTSISKKTRLEVAFPDQLPMIKADVSQIRQIVLNLVINASEAIGSNNGQIAVKVSTALCTQDCPCRAFTPEANEWPDRQTVVLEVSDNGCGMDQETCSKIFDPFFTTKFVGRGLGMAAVHGILRGHKAGIEIDSKQQEGTTFRIHFPIEAQTTTVTTMRTNPRPSHLGGGTILLVDDEQTVRQTTSTALKRLGYKVVTATNGAQAIEVFDQHKEDIACIILDMMMPTLSGEETFPILRNIRQDIPIVVSSGFSQEETAKRFEGLAIDAFIQKPYRLEMLGQTLRDILPIESEDSQPTKSI